MENNIAKIGVSNWIFELENGTTQNLHCIIDETVKISCDGKIEIILKESTYKEELIYKFYNGENLNKLIQVGKFISPSSEIIYFEFNYENLKIDSIKTEITKCDFVEYIITITNR